MLSAASFLMLGTVGLAVSMADQGGGTGGQGDETALTPGLWPFFPVGKRRAVWSLDLGVEHNVWRA